jgi:P27 family predicted phage terminase small subunit
MRGRKPTPLGLRILRGNPSKRKLPKDTPIPEGDLNHPPEWMSRSQKSGWRYAIRNAPAGLLTRLDRSTLTTFIVAESLHRQAAEAIEKYGLLIKTPNTNSVMQTPHLAILNRQAIIMLRAVEQLGFSPVARGRVHVAPTVKPSKWDAL